MGVSTDAYLFYGITQSEDEDGIPEWLEKHLDEDQDYWDLSKILMEKFGVEIGMHCHEDDPMYFLSVGKHQYAWRGSPKKAKFKKGDDWDDKINAAADYLGWPKEERDINWWLASYWG